MKYYLGKMKLLLLAVGIISVGLIFTWFKLLGNVQPNQNNNIRITGTITPGQKLTASLSIDFGNGKLIAYEDVAVNSEDTAYSLLIKKMSETDTNVKTKAYDFGIMVESIGETNASTTHFWSYFVNGEMGNVAADKYVLKGGDKVEWKYTKIQ